MRDERQTKRREVGLSPPLSRPSVSPRCNGLSVSPTDRSADIAGACALALAAEL